MISFFRKIRKKLLSDGKTGKYIKYAIGEIILVVIGILIALQVNNWNEQRKLNKREKAIIQSLHSEVIANKSFISDCNRQIMDQMILTDSLQTYLGPDYPGLSEDRLLILIGATGSAGRCPLDIDILNELRSSGNLNLIQNTSLRQSISQWTTAFNQLKSEEEEWNRDFSTQYLPYTNKWISWDDIDYNYDQLDTINESTRYELKYIPSKFEYDANKMLQEFEYANLLSIQIWRMNRILNLTYELQEKTNSLDSLLSLEKN